ncbi:MAG: RNA polymerase sigma factor [Candidatus Aminicenantes bacterium]|nr:MAG: RNA polymerase sigma factor [Candidatus Aminicenantes bacterium]
MNDLEFNLIEKAKKGDHEAFNSLLLKEQKFILNLMFQLTGERAEAEDLTQDALLLAYRKIQGFRHEAGFRTWLSKIAINLFRQKYRRKPKHISICLEKVKVPADDSNPERLVIKRELQWCIIHNLQQHVPKKYRMVLVLRDLHNFSYKEISEILGWSLSKTKTMLHRARQIFRNHFINGKCKVFAKDYLCICEGILDL